MRLILVSIVAGLLAATMMSSAQTAQVESSVPVADNELTGTWFVELASAPGVDGTPIATLEREEAGFHAAATGAGIRYSESRHFRQVWNGVTVNAAASDAPKLRALPGVQAVYPVTKIALEQFEQQPGPVPDLVTALAMTGADVAQSDLGLTGRGVRVAVIDSGIDYNHPDLGGCFGRGCRVTKGFDFVGDSFNAASADPAQLVPHPDPDPDDCNGHGTHVSGIIGANGGITGVAPGVRFHAYRVFGCEGSTTSDILLAAMEMAKEDGADVVNMSIGSPLAWPQYPTAKGADALVRHGIVVVASIGNDGALGLYAASAPGVGRNVIGVASFDNSHVNLVAFTVSPDDAKVGYIEATGAPLPPVTGAFPMARTGTVASTSDGCEALAPGSLTGMVALIRRGTCSFNAKAANAQAAGAAGVVIYNNAPDFISATVVGAVPITIPVVTITATNGALIDSRLAAGAVTMTWTNLLASEPQSTGGLISSFSSYGPPPDLSFKPDIGAPGGSIRSTLPLEQGGYGNLSGTSMSSPHVAGAVALLLQAHPHASPREVEQRLQNTARPQLWSGNPGLGVLDVVHRQGAGMLRIDDAVQSDAIVSPGSLALGEVVSGSITRTLHISLADPDKHRERHWWHKTHRRDHGRNDDDDDDEPITYTLGHQPALTTGPDTFTPSFSSSFATVTFSRPTVSLCEHHQRFGGDVWVSVTITAPTPEAARLFGGYITLTPSDGGPVLRVPYLGYHGDYQAIVALTPTPAGFPLLAKVIGTSLVPQPTGATYTLQGGDLPYIALHLDHQVRHLAMEVFDQTTGASVGFADIEDFLPRNSAPTSFFAFAWDGTVIKDVGDQPHDVANGAYRVELSVLKALGDPRNPAHTERWTSPNIVISRP